VAELRPIAVDLFAGVGGMTLGFEQAGFDVVAAVEHDAAHAAAHNFNFPHCQVLQADALTLTPADVLDAVRAGLKAHGRTAPRRPMIDVVFGGPPCQGFSVGGHMDATDPRNRLVERFVWLVEQLEPRGFVLENVPAMASRVLPRCKHPVPEWLRRRLGARGYDVQDATTLNASRFGVPQDRRRLLIVGAKRGETLPSLPAPTYAARTKRPDARAKAGEHGHAKTSASLPVGASVADAIGDLPDLDRFDVLLTTDAVILDTVHAVLARGVRSSYAAILAGDTRDPSDLSAPRAWDTRLLSSSLRTVHAEATIERFESTDPGDFEPVSRFYRLHPDGLSGTLRAGSTPDRGSFSAPRPIHPEKPRVISVREAARLQGFPDWFRMTAAKWHGFRQVGNAVPPPLARAVASSVRDALELPLIAAEQTVVVGNDALLRVPSGSGRRQKPRRRRESQPEAAAT